MKVPEVLGRLAEVLATQAVESDRFCLAFKFQEGEQWYVDTRQAEAIVTQEPRAFDCVYELSHAAFRNLAEGKVSPQRLFFDGELEVKGDLRLVRQLSLLAKAIK